MKKSLLILLTVVALLLTGCNTTEQPATPTDVSSSSVGNVTSSIAETNTEEPEQSVVEKPVSSVVSEPDKTESSQVSKPTESKPTSSAVSSKPNATVSKPSSSKPQQSSQETEFVSTPVANYKDVERCVAKYINSFRSTKATVLPGMTEVARYRSNMLVTNFTHDNARDACDALKYGEYVDMTLYGMSASDSYYRGFNAEAIGKGQWFGTADIMGKNIAEGFRNSPGHWSYLSSDEYSYMAVGCTYDEKTGYWYCCVLMASKNYDNF